MATLHFSRRRFVQSTFVAATTVGLAPKLFALTDAACTLTPEQEVGPFYVDGELFRSAIAEDKPGIPLLLHITLLDSRTCTPLSNAAIDLWHCDASGLYSGYTKSSMLMPPGGGPTSGPGGDPSEGHGPPPGEMGPPLGDEDHRGSGDGPPMNTPTDKLTFCRGIQLTDDRGSVNFNTIFPGFYQGRVNHIHLKARIDGHRDGMHFAGGHTSHAGQIFFPEELAVALMQQEPYKSHNIHRTTQAEDMVFRGQHGETVIAALATQPQGYRAAITISVDPTATPKPVGGGGNDGPHGPRPPRA